MFHKKFLILPVLLVVFVLVGCQSNSQKHTENQERNFTEIPQQQQNTDSIDTSDWQTYTNEEFGFVVKYPKNWEVIEDVEKSNIAKNDGFLGDFYIIKKKSVSATDKNAYIKNNADGVIAISVYDKNKREKKLNKECNFGIINPLDFNLTVKNIQSCRYYRQLDIFGHHYFVINQQHDDNRLYALSVEAHNKYVGENFIEKVGDKKKVFPHLTEEEIRSMQDSFELLDSQMHVGEKIIETFQFIDYKN